MYEDIAKNIKSAIERDPLDLVPQKDLFDLCRSEGLPEFSLWLRNFTWTTLSKLARMGDYSEAENADRLLQKILFLRGRDYFEDYLLGIDWGKPYDKKFYLPRRSYLKRYVDAYQRVADGELDFLSISMPKRAVDRDCKVLTPKGFVKHGDLKEGDYVFGRDGRPKKVLIKHPDCKMEYEVVFSNGEKVIVNGDHDWVVFDKKYNREVVTSVNKMLDTGLNIHGQKVLRWRYIIPMCDPVDMPDNDSLMPGYSLGAWLGDGTTSKPLMTNDRKDSAIIDRMLADGFDIGNQWIDKNYGTLVTHFTSDLTDALRRYGMCHRGDKGNKHIPTEYFTASRKQRLELLAGLIDTDGFVEKGKHRVSISTIYPALRDGIITLVSTFGWDARCVSCEPNESTSGIHGRHTVYRITFAPDCDIPTVLERKMVSPTGLPRRVSIRAINKIMDDRVGNCITVEGGEYRVGMRQVLTHNCGKSQTGINFINFLSGRRPDRSTLAEGTGDDLIKSFYNGCLEYLVQPNDYHFYDIFPERKLVQTSADTKIFNLDTKNRFPTVMCRSIDSRQVGLSEATNLLYLDDCVEGREESKNRQRLDDKWEVISGDVVGRAIEGTPIVICGTRYSIYDPIGRLQEQMHRQGKRMEILETPALSLDTDESNFCFYIDGSYRFTTQYFRDQREMLTAEQFESEFQQQPFEAKGILFPAKDLNYYYELPVDKEPDTIVAVVDTAEKGDDYCAMPIAAVYGEDVYIIDVVFNDAPPTVTKPEVAKKLMDNKVVSATFESNNAGEYFGRDVNDILASNGYKCGIRAKRTISNKQTRIEFASVNIIKHFYFKHPTTYSRGSEYWQFMHQVTTHTRSGKVPHDDAPDSLSLLENELRNIFKTSLEIVDRPF